MYDPNRDNTELTRPAENILLPGCHLSICQRVRCSDRIQPEAHARGRTISLMAFGVQRGHSRGVL